MIYRNINLIPRLTFRLISFTIIDIDDRQRRNIFPCSNLSLEIFVYIIKDINNTDVLI